MLAVFDLDHTLFRVNASFEFGRYLYQCGAISTLDACSCSYFYLKHKIWTNSHLLHHKIFQRIFLGKSKLLFNSLAVDFLDRNWGMLIAPKIVGFLEEEQRRQKQIVLLSNSPQFLLDEIGRRFGLRASIGTEYAVDQANIFCSVEKVMDGKNKREVIASMAEKADIDARAVKVYTDSLEDYPLLEYAGKAVYVNPRWHLRRYCQKKGWEIIG